MLIKNVTKKKPYVSTVGGYCSLVLIRFRQEFLGKFLDKFLRKYFLKLSRLNCRQVMNLHHCWVLLMLKVVRHVPTLKFEQMH